MLLQADLGDRAGAVSTYHHCASVLERELGVIPDPAWRAEVGRLLPAEGREERDTGSRAMVEAWQRHRFFEGLARAMMAVGPTGRRCRSRPQYQACSRSATRVTGRSSGSLPPSATGPPQCGSPTNTWRPKRGRMLAWAGSAHSRWGKPYVTGPPSREKVDGADRQCCLRPRSATTRLSWPDDQSGTPMAPAPSHGHGAAGTR